MKIAVDARPLIPPLTGIGRYTYELLQRLVQSEHEWYLYSNVPLNYDFLTRSNVTVYIMPFAGGWPGLSTIAAQLVYPVWAKQHCIDVFWSPRHHLPLMLSLDIPSVLTIHDLVWMYFPETMSKLGRILEKWLMPPSIRKASAIVAVSHATLGAVVKEFYVEPERLSVVTPAPPKGVVLQDRSKLLQMGLKQPYMLFVGTVEPRKNLINLLSAFAALPEQIRDKALFVIVGGKGWGGVDLDEHISLLGLKKHVRVLGYIDESTLALLYSEAMFLAMPSLYEGFGMPIVEAMQYGKAVLTSNNSSMPEVASDAGFLVNPSDEASMIDGLQEMITNSELRGGLAENAKSSAARFDWDISSQQLMAVFEKAMLERAKSLR